MADTMDLWIQTQHQELLRLLGRVDGLLVNDSEALLLTDSHNLIDAGKAILDLGPEFVVIKKGEHGALLFRGESIVPLPAFPVARVLDPTGAGDSFAGALMGHVSRVGSCREEVLKEALAHGTVAASFTVQDFGVARIAELRPEHAERRFEEYRDILRL
jgi:sugar/nucleoside kinase (ribokinase family)